METPKKKPPVANAISKTTKHPHCGGVKPEALALAVLKRKRARRKVNSGYLAENRAPRRLTARNGLSLRAYSTF